MRLTYKVFDATLVLSAIPSFANDVPTTLSLEGVGGDVKVSIHRVADI